MNGNNSAVNQSMKVMNGSPRRFPPVPNPFQLQHEIPRPTVPDVSLIFDSPSSNSKSHTVTNNNSHNGSSPSLSSSLQTPPAKPIPSPTTDASASPATIKLFKYLLDVTKAQGKIIKKMEAEIQTLKENEEKHFQELMGAIKARPAPALDGGSPTAAETVNPNQHGRNMAVAIPDTENTDLKDQLHAGRSKTRSNSSGSEKNSDRTRKISKKSKKADKTSNPPMVTEKVTPPRQNQASGANGAHSQGSLSKVFRNLELPAIQEQEQSMCSENSICQIDLHGFNNGRLNVGGSSSECETSSTSEEETNGAPIVPPTGTYYRKVLGCVHRILEDDSTNNNAPPPCTPPQQRHAAADYMQTNINISANFSRTVTTDTTLYGYPSNCFSFSSKQYMQRHQLMHSGSPGSPKPNRETHGHGYRQGRHRPTHNRNTYGSSSDSSDERILDVTALKNQPKLH